MHEHVGAPHGAHNPGWIYVLADSGGFVGAFRTQEELDARVMRKYGAVPMILHRYEWDPAGDPAHVWVVRHPQDGTVLFVTNSRPRAERIQRQYHRVGVVSDENIDYWIQRLGEVRREVLQRLDSTKETLRLYADDAPKEEAANVLEWSRQRDLETMRIFGIGVAEDGPVDLLSCMEASDPAEGLVSITEPSGSCSTAPAGTCSAAPAGTCLAEPATAGTCSAEPATAGTCSAEPATGQPQVSDSTPEVTGTVTHVTTEVTPCVPAANCAANCTADGVANCTADATADSTAGNTVCGTLCGHQ